MKPFPLCPLIFAFVLRCLALSASAAATLVIAPNDNANTEGNSAANYPFDGIQSSMRLQQVYNASQFSAIANGGGFITGIGFRGNQACGGVSAQTDASLQMNFSTTSKAPDSLSPIFAENVGFDDHVVRGPRSLTLDTPCTSDKPQLFAIFAFDSPFFYNPASGNLLMDIRNLSGPMFANSQLVLDAQNTVGDSVSSIVAFNVNRTSADEVSSSGYVTEFFFLPVPEPSTWALFGFGLAVVSWSVHWKDQRRKNGPH